MYLHASASKWIEEDLIDEKEDDEDEEEEDWMTTIR